MKRDQHTGELIAHWVLSQPLGERTDDCIGEVAEMIIDTVPALTTIDHAAYYAGTPGSNIGLYASNLVSEWSDRAREFVSRYPHYPACEHITELRDKVELDLAELLAVYSGIKQ